MTLLLILFLAVELPPEPIRAPRPAVQLANGRRDYGLRRLKR
jgi:hypothetical protein